MDMTLDTWMLAACLGGAGGAAGAWLAPRGAAGLAFPRPDPAGRTAEAARLGIIALAAATSAAVAWMIAGSASPVLWIGVRPFPAGLACFWVGFVTAGWVGAERDKRVLRQAVCSAATAPAAHPDTVQALAHASPDAVYEAVKALVPRRAIR